MPKFNDFDLDVQNIGANQPTSIPRTEYCPSCVSPNCTDIRVMAISANCTSFHSENMSCRCEIM